MAEEKRAISAEGRAEIEAELEHLRGPRRAQIVGEIKEAREHGDLSENAEYHAAREAQGHNESRIRVLEHHLATSEVSEATGDGSVQVGSAVSYRDAGGGELKDVTVVHPLEAVPAEGKISSESPIGEALIGERAGTEVEFETPRGGAKRIEIVSVG